MQEDNARKIVINLLSGKFGTSSLEEKDKKELRAINNAWKPKTEHTVSFHKNMPYVIGSIPADKIKKLHDLDTSDDEAALDLLEEVIISSVWTTECELYFKDINELWDCYTFPEAVFMYMTILRENFGDGCNV